MWETPIYRFNQEAGKDPEGNRVYKQIVIDVTRSAPSFASPGIALAGALDEAVAVTGIGPKDTILDFGTGGPPSSSSFGGLTIPRVPHPL